MSNLECNSDGCSGCDWDVQRACAAEREEVLSAHQSAKRTIVKVSKVRTPEGIKDTTRGTVHHLTAASHI